MATKFLAKKGLGLLGRGKKGAGQRAYKADVKKFLTRPNKGEIAFQKEIGNLIEEFDGPGVSYKYGRKLGKGAMSGEKRMKGRYFSTTKYPKGRK